MMLLLVLLIDQKRLKNLKAGEKNQVKNGLKLLTKDMILYQKQ